MRLFLEQRFDKTTVDQIAAEAGLSRTSLHRYFATKEDVLLGDLEERGTQVLEALVARPAGGPPGSRCATPSSRSSTRSRSHPSGD
jgi:AcrR family transcriptional regulator